METRRSKVILCLVLPVAGAVLGFCAGGFYGHALGSHAGHGLGDLGYLFNGCILGLLAGEATAVFGALKWSERARRVIAVQAVAAAVGVAGVTFLLVNFLHAW